MTTRPTSVTVIAWILIVTGAISLISTTIMFNNAMVRDLMSQSPIPIPIQYALTYTGLLISIICGTAFLKGCNWARLLYVIWCAVNFVISFTTSPLKWAMVPGLVVYMIIVFLLFRPKVTDYFSPTEPGNDAQCV